MAEAAADTSKSVTKADKILPTLDSLTVGQIPSRRRPIAMADGSKARRLQAQGWRSGARRAGEEGRAGARRRQPAEGRRQEEG